MIKFERSAASEHDTSRYEQRNKLRFRSLQHKQMYRGSWEFGCLLHRIPWLTNEYVRLSPPCSWPLRTHSDRVMR